MANKLEEIYDNEISPLMGKIIEVCKKHELPMVASFQLDYDEEEESFLKCTTYLEHGSPDDSMKKARHVLYGEGSSTMAITVSKAN